MEKKTIMIVDESAEIYASMFQRIFANLLGVGELEVMQSKSVKEAQDKLLEALPVLPDFILINFEMCFSSQTGLDFLKFIRSDKRLKKIFVFMMIDEEPSSRVMMEAIQLSCQVFVKSPSILFRICELVGEKWRLDKTKAQPQT